MKKLLREPLLHFLLIGAVIFAAYQFRSPGTEPGRIVITPGQIESMSIGFSRTWHRPPDSAELEGMIQDRIREEVYYREALAMGLDRDDSIIRRRLRQKFEFVTDDVAALVEPTDVELTEYLASHAESFRLDRQFTFQHVFLNPERHGVNLESDAADLLRRLRGAGAGADVESFGDAFLLERRFDDATEDSIASQFGEKFAADLARVPLGQWTGPVQSGYGVHLVLVEERREGYLPELAQVRDAVRREWSNTQRLESNEKLFQKLLTRYQVIVETPKPGAAAELVARTE